MHMPFALEKLRPNLCTTPLHPQLGEGKSAQTLTILLPTCKKMDVQKARLIIKSEYQYNWQNYWLQISNRFCHTAVNAGNWALVLALDLVWKQLDKLRIAQAINGSHRLLPAVENLNGSLIYSVQKRWLYGVLRPYWTVQEENTSLRVDKQKLRRILHLTSAPYSKVINFSACQPNSTKPGTK